MEVYLNFSLCIIHILLPTLYHSGRCTSTQLHTEFSSRQETLVHSLATFVILVLERRIRMTGQLVLFHVSSSMMTWSP